MFGLGIWELLILLLIVVVIFGVGNLPNLGRQLGKAVNEVRSVSGTNRKSETEESEDKKAAVGSEDLVGGLKELGQLRTTSGKLRLIKRLTKKL